MHVLSCRVRDKVLIGDAVRIEVLEVAEDHVRIAVHSPGQFPEYEEQVLYIAEASGIDATDESSFIPADPDRHLVGA